MKKLIASLLSLTFVFACSCSPLDFLKGDKGATSNSESEEDIVKLAILEGKGEVYPYGYEIKMYLEADAQANVAHYLFSTNNQASGIKLAWECDAENVTNYIVRYGMKNCAESEKIEITLDGKETEYELFNLYKGAQYDWSVTAVLENSTQVTQNERFTTTDLGPRVLQIDGVYNTRDVGGYTTEDGKKTKQGLMFRGGELPAALRASAQKCFSETLGIKTELDLRGDTEESGFRKESPISGANLVKIVTDGYMGAYRLTDNFRQVFSLMANEANYPMYVHCTGGADRTGTVFFLVNALLGVPELQLIKDYEFTSFSKYGERNSRAGTTYGDMFQDFLTKLKSYDGETLAKKTENYMLSIGVTQTEIDNIRKIMLSA